MQYWRMQLHPSDAALALRHSVQSIAAGFIGLDFAVDPGDLTKAQASSLPPGQTDYWDFAHRMRIGDKVLIVVHHFPFALVTVAGDYNYLKSSEPEIGVWFRHFRRIDPNATACYGDWVTDVRKWEQLRMTDTISILKDPGSRSYQLIDTWP
jgi:hypothetical protein